MPATQEINITKLGIIAGGGSLPTTLVDTCNNKNIEPFIVGFNGQTNSNLIQKYTHLWAKMGEVGKIIKFFKNNNVKNLVLIGSIKRPSFTEIKPDLKAMKILSKIGLKALGDNGLLTLLKNELENEGFVIHAMHKFCEGLLMPEGDIGKYSPKIEDKITIDLGLKISQEIGALDIGQSVIVQNGLVIGVEAIEGTDELINRCATLLQNGRGGILVKTCKPQQDKSLDMPTIGANTIINAHKAGLCGIVVQSSNVIVVDIKNVVKLANKYNIFVLGLPIKQSIEI